MRPAFKTCYGLHRNTQEGYLYSQLYVYVNMHLSGALITIMFFVVLQLVYTQTVFSTTQKPILTCDQPGHASCYSIGYSKGLVNTQASCSATTLNSFVIANPSQVNNFCSGYRVAAQQALQQQR
jgi:hypothetical protein